MNIEKNAVVAISYTLKEKNATDVVEKVEANDPFVFLFGAGQLLEKFEANLLGKTKGDAFDFMLSPEESYGTIDPSAIVDVPITVFMHEGKLLEDLVIPGKVVRLQDQEGNPLMGMVMERKLETVLIDFNHPMAGRTLHFIGEVIDVRRATEEEVSHGHAHGIDGGHHH